MLKPVEEERDGGHPDGEDHEEDGGLLGADQGAAIGRGGVHGQEPRAVGGRRGGEGRRGGCAQVHVVLGVPVVVRPSHPRRHSL